MLKVDSFVALADKKQWGDAPSWLQPTCLSANALKSLESHAVPIERVGNDDLDAMTIDWSFCGFSKPSGLTAEHVHRIAASKWLEFCPEEVAFG